MPLHNDEDLYPLRSFIEGCKVNGSGPDDRRAQFSFAAIVFGIIGEMNVLHFQNATKEGQTVVGNIDGVDTTDAPGFNDDNKFIATIKVFPPATNDDLDFLVKYSSR